jgi:hypothetical protein
MQVPLCVAVSLMVSTSAAAGEPEEVAALLAPPLASALAGT